MGGNPTWAQVVAQPTHLAGKHPAEISGPSWDPEKQLMNLPPEIRIKIWRCVYVKASHVRLRCPWQPGGTKTPSIGPNGIISMLSANKQAQEEGLQILYGENHFENYSVQVYKKGLVNRKYLHFSGIGRRNTAIIQTATFEVPLDIIEGFQDTTTCGPFLEFLCAGLVGLRELTIKTQTVDCSRNIGNVARWYQKQSIRAILTTAARITKYHPILRKAVWRCWSGSEVKNGVLVANFYIDLFEEGSAPALGSMTTKDAHGEDVKSSDMILDCALIRRTPWLKCRLWDEVAAFKLPDKVDPSSVNADSNTKNTRSSETDHDAITIWPGMQGYDPLLEVSYDDQVDLVRRRRGKVVNGDFVPGDMANGKFVKGHWFGSDFIEGDWIGPRLVDGKLVPHQFTPGKWVGDKLIEGNMVDGVFVQGIWVMETFMQGKWIDGLFTKGRWDCESFIEGKWAGSRFVEGKWQGGALCHGAWVKKLNTRHVS